MKTEMSIRLGQRLAARRRELDLTQREVAAKIAALLPEHAPDKQRVSDWETGTNVPSDRYKPAIVEVLKVDDFSYFYMAPEESTETETPDLSMQNGDTQRFKIIERKLDRILALLDPAGEEERDVADALAPTADIPESPQPPADDAQQIPPAARRRKSASS